MHFMVRDMPECFARAWYICGGTVCGWAGERGEGAKRTWSRKPMPVEMSISWVRPVPGWQSRLMETEICVSFVLRSMLAVRAAMSAGSV